MSGMVRGGDDDQSVQSGDGDQPEYGSMGRDEGDDELHDDQSKDGQEGGVIGKRGLNSTGGSSWLGTQEDRDDFVTLSDEFLSRTGALEDDIGKKMEEDWQKVEDGQATVRGDQEDDVRLVTSLAEKIVCPGDQPQTNLGVVQDVRTNTNRDMVGLTSTIVGVQDATTRVATANLNNPLGDHNPECQSFFVRMGINGMNVVSRSEERVEEYKMMSTGDFVIMDSTLELVEVLKIVGLVRNNGSTTEPSSGEKFVQLSTMFSLIAYFHLTKQTTHPPL